MRGSNTDQLDFLEANEARAGLDQLISEARLYRTSKDFAELMDFTARLRNFAPFNAMLLHIQKPGLTYAAWRKDWRELGRTIKPDARPLLILMPFSPVALVYDVLDTEGKELPRDVSPFKAYGPVTAVELSRFEDRLTRKRIEPHPIDAGDARAGYIEPIGHDGEHRRYRLAINRNHAPAVRFSTLAHELAHLFLGHLGEDQTLKVSGRTGLSHAQREMEAECAAYLLCKRNGVDVRSETYLNNFVSSAPDVDVYTLMRAVGQIEALLKISNRVIWNK